MRIGLFGGTFNPIHFGHLRVALEIHEGFSLDSCYLIPSAIPPHKSLDGIIDAQSRLEMVRLAASNTPGFAVSDIEINRSGPSYTIDTVRRFKSMMGKDATFFFIVGLDAFLEIDTWNSCMELFRQISFIVMTRPGAGCEAFQSKNVMLEAFLKEKISGAYRYSASRSCFVHPEMHRVLGFEVSSLDISSTRIRKQIRNGKSIQFLVPEKVRAYIKARGLYT